MKVFKTALLGAAALSAVSVGARADNLSDLKAQIEALNARIASVESAPALPADYQMISFSKLGDEHVISIMPTADIPAPTTEIKWSGYVRVALVTTFDSTRTLGNQYSTDVASRAKLKVVGKTDTAVGEVGVSIEFKGTDVDKNFNTNAGQTALQTDGYYGWWKVTPNLIFSGGTSNTIQKGTLAKSGYSFDAACTCYYTDGFGAIDNTPFGKGPFSTSASNNPSQFTLAYADGPLGLAVALEDSNNAGNNSALGVSGKGSYKMDMVGFDINGGYWGSADGQAAWSVSGGIGFNMSPIKFGAAVGTGNSGSGTSFAKSAGNAYNYTNASGYAIIALGDSASAEFGIVHDFGGDANDKLAGATIYEAGLYYSPVKQLVIGVEGQYQTGGAADQSYTADIATVWKF